jgi:FkbM family methyltransferase
MTSVSMQARRLLRRPARPRLVTVEVPGTGHFLVAREATSDLAAFRHVFGGAYDFELPRPPRLIFDLGANVGYAAVFFALRYPQARIVAVEPVKSNLSVLRRNARAFPQIDVVPGAAWPHSDRLAVEDVGKGYWGMRVRRTGRLARGVRGVTVPHLLRRSGADRVDLVKIDIEGSELELFSTEADWVARVGAFAIEFHDRFRPGCREAFDTACARAGAVFTERQQGEATVLIRDDAASRPPQPDEDG